MSTYVGGSASCVAHVIGMAGLEALYASAVNVVGHDADRISPVPVRD